MVNEKNMITSQPVKHSQDFPKLLYMNIVMNIPTFPFSSWEMGGGNFIIVVDLTRDHSAGCNYLSEPVNGNLRIKIDYKEPLKESIQVFCMAEFNKIFFLDSNRNPEWSS